MTFTLFSRTRPGINKMAFVLYWHQQHGFSMKYPAAAWSSRQGHISQVSTTWVTEWPRQGNKQTWVRLKGSFHVAGQSSQSGHSPIPHRCNPSLVQHMVAGSYCLIPEGYLSSINLVRGWWTRRFQNLGTSKIAFPPAPNPTPKFIWG